MRLLLVSVNVNFTRTVKVIITAVFIKKHLDTMLPFVLKLWIESVFVDFVESVHWASGKYRHTELLDVKRNLRYYFINFAKLNYKYLNT